MDLAGIHHRIHSAAKLDKLNLTRQALVELQGNFLVPAVHKKVALRLAQQIPFVVAAALRIHSAVWDRSVCNSG